MHIRLEPTNEPNYSTSTDQLRRGNTVIPGEEGESHCSKLIDNERGNGLKHKILAVKLRPISTFDCNFNK